MRAGLADAARPLDGLSLGKPGDGSLPITFAGIGFSASLGTTAALAADALSVQGRFDGFGYFLFLGIDFPFLICIRSKCILL